MRSLLEILPRSFHCLWLLEQITWQCLLSTWCRYMPSLQRGASGEANQSIWSTVIQSTTLTDKNVVTLRTVAHKYYSPKKIMVLETERVFKGIKPQFSWPYICLFHGSLSHLVLILLNPDLIIGSQILTSCECGHFWKLSWNISLWTLATWLIFLSTN